MRERIDRFLFGEADALSAALFRIGLALVIALVFRAGERATVLVAALERIPAVRATYDALFLSAPYWWSILALLAALALGWRVRVAGFALVALLAPLAAVGRRWRSPHAPGTALAHSPDPGRSHGAVRRERPREVQSGIPSRQCDPRAIADDPELSRGSLGFWFRRLRVPVALLGVGFHSALTLVIQIGYLDLVSVFLYAAFLLPFDRRARRRHDPAPSQ